jgi:alpha 1,2-mannosyltransferase
VYPLKQGLLLDVPVNLPREVRAVLQSEYPDLERIAREIPVIEQLRSLAANPAPPMPPMTGRGIVTTAAEKYAGYLTLLLASLKEHHCPLPVEVWHRPGEITTTTIAALSSEQVTFPVFDESRQPPNGFACKPAALVASRFAEVLFLDADNSVLANPSQLFDSPSYAVTGALFWPDQSCPPRREAELRRMLELSVRFTPVESGQLLIDKRRHWRGLHLINQLNLQAEVIYRFVHGDKDTFPAGFEMAGEAFQIVPLRPHVDRDGSFRHFAPDRRPMFHHRAAGQAKFF